MIFRDRRHAGRILAARCTAYAGRDDVVVLALPRGGVPVGFELARALDAPLDVFLVRKLGVPGHPELAMGAIASGGVRVLDPRLISDLRISPDAIERVAVTERRELERREREYRAGYPPIDLAGRTVLLVDDGLATGSSMRAAIQAVRRLAPARVVVAVPVAPSDTARALADVADEVICAAEPERFWAVGGFYQDFEQTSDAEVRALLEQASARRSVESEISRGGP